MKILVINGSPKGDYSCTLHTALYIQKKYTRHTFTFYNAGSKIRQAEKDFSEAAGLIREADLLMFCYPVYTFIAPSQLHRFIALMKENFKPEELQGKFATQITTSKHFYDVTAHAYIQENCQDMGLKFIKGLSADMDDLPKKKGQKDALSFFHYVLWCVKNDVYEAFPLPAPAPSHKKVTVPGAEPEEKILQSVRDSKQPEADSEKKCIASESAAARKSIALVADLASDDTQLADMIARFTFDMKKCSYLVRLVNIHDFPFRGGCISCFNCAVDGTCIYKDGFSEMLRDEIQTCSAIVLAFSIQDHSMGTVFKTYDDRQFCNGHRTVTMGKPFGYLVSGDYSREKNLQMIIDGRAEVGGNFLAGVATDEFQPDEEIDQMAKRLDYCIRRKYVQPANFLGVGGMKIFRDLIWLMQGMMKADHKFYKQHGMYDFPQKNWSTMLAMYLVGALISNPDVKKKMGNKMNEGMVAPYKKVIDKA